jgi:large subunit ribosomal protein L9
MKVILLQDVKNVGKKGSVAEVSDGYATNFLFAKNLAVKATERGLEVKKEEEIKQKIENEKKKEEALNLKKELEKINLSFKAKSGKDGQMFGSISTKQICEELKNKHGIELDKRKFIDNQPISNFGWSRPKFELMKGIVAVINVEVKEEIK